MGTTLNVQLTDAQVALLEREAQRIGTSPSDVAARLVEEYLRMIEFPGIEFRESVDIREAYLRGTRLKVWHLRWYTNFDDADIPRIATDFNILPSTVADAFAYGRRYTDEIEASLAENRHIAENIEQYVPEARICTVNEAAS